MMPIKAIAWDIDGTLVDSEPLHLRALIAGCRNWGFDVSGLPEEKFRGVHLIDVWNELRSELPPGLGYEEWRDVIDRYYVDHRRDVQVTPGAAAVVRHLDEMGLRQVAVSNSGRAIVDANLNTVGINSVLAFSISLDDVERGKPDAQPYALACERLNLKPQNLIAVEDSRTGTISARSAGLVVAGFGATPWEPGETDVILQHLQELPDYVMKLNQSGRFPA